MVFWSFPDIYLQTYTIIIFVVLLAGMIYDFVLKKKLAYTLEERKFKSSLRSSAFRPESKQSSVGVVTSAILVDILTSRVLGRCGLSRRLSHILMLWGFILSVLGLLGTIFFSGLKVVIFPYSPLVFLGIPGNLMLFIGSIWYLPQRVNVSHEGDNPLKVVPADAFVLNLIVASVFGLAYCFLSFYGMSIFVETTFLAYLSSMTVLVLFGPWTKFPHMFYKGGVIILDKIDESKGITALPSKSRTE